MCSPIVGGGLALGSIFSAFSGSKAVGQEIDASNKAISARASNYESQAAYRDKQAQDAVDRGESRVLSLQEQLNQTLAAQRVGFAKSGVALDDGGSVQAVADSSKYENEQDIATTRKNASMEADAMRNEANQMRQQANFDRMSMVSSKVKSQRQRSSLLNGLLNVPDVFYKYKSSWGK